MTKIEHTNIVIDDFSFAKRDVTRTYTHILTHVHTDHTKGLYDGWNYGPIYCTRLTSQLIKIKFPSLTCLQLVEYNQPITLKMSNTLQVTATFLDANHIPGSAMVLLQGYMGTVLYTGDIRFDRTIFGNYEHLYPPQKITQEFKKCSKHVDVLYLDNTFLKQKFQFPPRKEALKQLVNYIQGLTDLGAEQPSRIFICLDSIGKEETLVELATHFQTYIAVDSKKYDVLKAMEYDAELFTTKAQEGVIEVIRKNDLFKKLSEYPGSVGIILSGWVNKPYHRKPNVYCIPYSLHSNYTEIHQFVASIGPSFIYPIVQKCPDQNQLYYAGKKYISKDELMFKQDQIEMQGGDYSKQMEELRKLYSTPASEEYTLILDNNQVAKKILEELKPPKPVNFGNNDKCTLPGGMQTNQRKKYSFTIDNKNQKEVEKLRKQIYIKRRQQNGQYFQEIPDSDDDPASKNQPQNNVIDLDGDQIPLEVEEEVEKDPFKEIFKNYSKKIHKREKREQNSFQKIKISNKSGSEGEVVILEGVQLNEQVPQKNKNHMASSSQNKGNSSQNSSSIENNLPHKPSSMGEVSLNRLKEMKIYTDKNEIKLHFKRNPRDIQLLRQYCKNNQGDL